MHPSMPLTSPHFPAHPSASGALPESIYFLGETYTKWSVRINPNQSLNSFGSKYVSVLFAWWLNGLSTIKPSLPKVLEKNTEVKAVTPGSSNDTVYCARIKKTVCKPRSPQPNVEGGSEMHCYKAAHMVWRTRLHSSVTADCARTFFSERELVMGYLTAALSFTYAFQSQSDPGLLAWPLLPKTLN